MPKSTKNQDLKEQINHAHELINKVKHEVKKVVIGQENLIRNLLITILAKGHIILEGVPGLAKTLSISTLAQTLNLDFSRIQFTPDLLPSDLIGTKVFDQNKASFYIKKGPIFANFVLADEINRAPSKVQSALLECMAEKQVTIGEETFKLDQPFIVLATQNPIEQEGTYNLPEAQMDRFLMKTVIDYPTDDEEIQIMKRFTGAKHEKIDKILDKNDIFKLIDLADQIYVSDNIFQYVKDIVFTTRFPEKYGLEDIKKHIAFGASPRASLALIQCAKVLAMMDKRDFVLPEDIKEISFDVLRHRIILSYEAIAENITSDDVVRIILNNTKII